MYAAMRGLVRLMVRVYLAGLFRVEGVERVPRTGPLLVCANHASTVDPPLLPAFLPRRPDGRRVENQEASDAIMLAVAEQLPAGMRGAYADLDALRQRLAGVWEPAPEAAGRAPSAR